MNKQQIIKYAKRVRGWTRNGYINFVVKTLVLVLVSFALYDQIFRQENIDEIYQEFRHRVLWENAWLMAVVILLMPVNWLLETLKWQRLVWPIEQVPLWRALKGVFSGVTLSLFTPNRVGEYGGRILVVQPENNAKTVVATLVGSFSQLAVLLVMGMAGLSSFIYFHIDLDPLLLYTIVFCSLIIAALLIFFYLNVDLVIPLLRRIPFVRRFVKHFEILRDYSAMELLHVLAFSLGRYIVYSLQYYLILRFFGIDLPLAQGLSGIALIFLVQTSIPLPPITGLLVRGEVALTVWSFFTVNKISILAATFGLWMVNVIIAAFLGLFFILNMNVVKSLGFSKGEKPVESPKNGEV